MGSGKGLNIGLEGKGWRDGGMEGWKGGAILTAVLPYSIPAVFGEAKERHETVLPPHQNRPDFSSSSLPSGRKRRRRRRRRERGERYEGRLCLPQPAGVSPLSPSNLRS